MSLKAIHATADSGISATREQLLAKATEVFAEFGFRNATIRDICQRAEANVAAVNYHFGGKEELYAEVLRRNFRGALRRFPADGGIRPDAPPAQRLRGFIRSFVQRIFVTGPDSCHGRMLAREMVDPTPALDSLVATEIRSLAASLESIVRDLLGPKVDDWEVRVCLASVVSQIVFYQHCRPVISRLFPDLAFDATNLEALVDHITTFSLAGIRATARRTP